MRYFILFFSLCECHQQVWQQIWCLHVRFNIVYYFCQWKLIEMVMWYKSDELLSKIYRRYIFVIHIFIYAKCQHNVMWLLCSFTMIWHIKFYMTEPNSMYLCCVKSAIPSLTGEIKFPCYGFSKCNSTRNLLSTFLCWMQLYTDPARYRAIMCGSLQKNTGNFE